MRIILAAGFVVVSSLSALAAPAPNFADMTQRQVQAYFANRTALEKAPQIGNVALFFRSNGTLYLGAAGSSRVEKSKWSVNFADNSWLICFASASRAMPAFRGKLTFGLCAYAKDFLRQADDFQPGDPLKLSSGKLKVDLGTKRTTLAKLLGKR